MEPHGSFLKIWVTGKYQCVPSPQMTSRVTYLFFFFSPHFCLATRKKPVTSKQVFRCEKRLAWPCSTAWEFVLELRLSSTLHWKGRKSSPWLCMCICNTHALRSGMLTSAVSLTRFMTALWVWHSCIFLCGGQQPRGVMKTRWHLDHLSI